METTSLGLPLRDSSDFYIGDLLVQPNLNQISTDNAQIRLEPKAMQVLLCLAKEPGKVCSKEQLIHSVWPDTFVTDQVLTHGIWQLRQAFSELDHQCEFIQTISKSGYRLVATVRPAYGPAKLPDSTSPKPTRTRSSSARLIALFTACILLLVGATVSIIRWRTPHPSRRITLLVLPFENLSGYPGQEYFSDGMTDEMIAQMARLNPNQLAVIARATSMTFKGSKLPVKQIAAKLNVDYVLEGSVRQDGDRVRITAQLIRGSDETHLWAESYEQHKADILRLQENIAQAIARKINTVVVPDDRKSPYAVDPEALDAYLRGNHELYRYTPESTKRAILNFQKAISIEPRYAAAHSALAFAYLYLSFFSSTASADTIAAAEAEVGKALELDETLAHAHATSGGLKVHYHYDWEGAEREYRRAVELEPNSSEIRWRTAWTLTWSGKFEEALVHITKALELDPRSVMALRTAGMIYYCKRDYEKALHYLEMGRELDPSNPLVLSSLGQVYIAQGKYAEAVKALEEERSRIGGESGGSASGGGRLGLAYALNGQTKEARAILSELLRLSETARPASYNMAMIYVGLGEFDNAFASFQNAIENHDGDVLVLKVFPVWDPVRSDPRYPALLRALRL